MADAASGRTARIAVALAGAAVVVVMAAMIVVVRGRRDPASPPVQPMTGSASDAAPIVVEARDVVRIGRGTVEPASDASGVIGIQINDAELLAALQLESTDVITAISGKPVRRQFDVFDALAGTSMMNATTLYIELLRDGQPKLVRWELDGDLREARTGVASTQRSPPAPVVPDPLVGTIKRITDHDYEMPRATFEQISSNARSGILSGIRLVPGYRSGVTGPIEGVKLYAIRPSSIWAALGIENGDRVQSVNGRPVLVGTLWHELFKASSARTVELAVIRRGAPISLKYSITR